MSLINIIKAAWQALNTKTTDTPKETIPPAVSYLPTVPIGHISYPVSNVPAKEIISADIKVKSKNIINREKFFKEYRKEFGNKVPQSVVDCLEAIFNEFDKHTESVRDIEKKAYMLATVRHEVGPNMVPIVENMNYTAKRITQVWPSRFKTIASAQPYAHNPEKLANNVYGNRLGNGPASSGDGYRYRGRGIGAQFTGKVNYIKFGKLFNVDLVNNPELAVDLELGAKILYKGSIEGLFTGVSLSKYITKDNVDYKNARRVVNADVGANGERVAVLARRFEKVLRASIS